MEPKYQITIDKFKCVGSTLCVQFAPQVFGLDEQKQSKVMTVDIEDEAMLVNAAEQCPMAAITVKNLQTGQRLCP